jgi:hypothetical protein
LQAKAVEELLKIDVAAGQRACSRLGGVSQDASSPFIFLFFESLCPKADLNRMDRDFQDKSKASASDLRF